MPLARKIAYNVVLNSLFKVFSTVVLSLYSIRLITEYLGPEGFGKYATVLAFFAFFSAIVDLGLAPVTVREISKEGADEKRILGKVMALRLISSAMLLLLAPLVLFFFDYETDLKIGIVVAAIAVLFSSSSLLLNGIFQKNLAMDRVAFVEFFGKLLQVILVTLIVRNDWGFLSIASTLLAALAFNAILVFWLSRSYAKFSLQFDIPFWKSFLYESSPLAATALITFAYFKLDTIILSVLQSSSDVGIYNVAYKIMENLIFFPAMLAGLILPLLSRTLTTDRALFEDIVDKTFKVFLLIVFPLVMGVWVLAPEIIAIVSGSGFDESARVLRVLIFALGFIFFGHYFTMLLVVSNAQRKLMKALLIAAIANVSLNLFFIPKYSYMAAASTSLFTEFLVVLLIGALAFKEIQFRPSFKPLVRILFATLLMAFAMYYLDRFSFIVAGLGGGVVYLFGLWLTRVVTYEEIKMIFLNKEARNVSPETFIP
jgi:O-antigen/teichoic acid export membrane protein